MIVRLLISMLAIAAVAQAQTPSLGPRDSDRATKAATVQQATPTAATAELPDDAVVIAIHGICPAAAKGSPCVTNITKAQFERMIAAISVNTQLARNPVALRSFADSYAQSLTLADAAEKAGIDKSPQFLELMDVVRVRTLAEAYRRARQAEYSKIGPEEIESYYKQNAFRYEQAELDRIFIPNKTRHRSDTSADAFATKALAVATAVRERAAKGEEMNKLQIEAYQSLGITPPLTTDMGTVRRNVLPEVPASHVFSLRAGEVTPIESDPGGFTIYKVRSRTSLSLDSVKEEIRQILSKKKMDEAAEAASERIHADLNPQFFRR